MSNPNIYITLVVFALIVGCDSEPTVIIELPSVNTGEITDITATSAITSSTVEFDAAIVCANHS